jgi:2-phosphoglycerate kinase
MCNLRVILIGGSSNVGKSTLAKSLADKLGWRCISTDSLARHPGRPWSARPEFREHVAEHYLSLSVEELMEDVLRHYKGMQPNIRSLISAHAADDSASRLIMEGSALWPEFIAALKVNNAAAIWLTASNRLFEKRIYDASHMGTATATEKKAIQKFLARTLRYNEQMMEIVNRLGLTSIDVESTAPHELPNRCLELLGQQL